MLVCLIITNFYLGEITSMVISPPGPDLIDNLDELEANNFSLYYPSKAWQDSAVMAIRNNRNPRKIILQSKLSQSRNVPDF